LREKAETAESIGRDGCLVLAYKPKPKSKPARKRKRKAQKLLEKASL
jgi:hypothetical protein